MGIGVVISNKKVKIMLSTFVERLTELPPDNAIAGPIGSSIKHLM
jgi:hypothetical protein